ncbi:MAG: ATP-binding protein [Clostridiales bacterium]|jgi:SpoVK/Ycf46/Vps4 family AAA+-type ATPase|nr:ATP-binding protein [Clostridiales bacterium]
MSNIKKDSDDAKGKTGGLSIEELKAEYAQAKEKIRALLKIKKDRNELNDKDKSAIRMAYLHAARTAKALSERVVDYELQKGYKDDYQKLSAAASACGSAIKSKIPDTKLDDVKGLKEVKRIINNFIFIAKNDTLVEQYNLQGGLGMLMYGPPGTGKTMMAEAIANAMNLPLFIITPADIFKSYVGESEQAVRDIFTELDSCEDGAILFVDECESIFSKRSQDTKDYKAAVTTELLQRMNGFGVSGAKRIMLAATNRPDAIDPAYLRFKRFSYQLYVELPDPEAKLEIIRKKIPPVGLADDITEEMILEMACVPDGNYSAADICGIIENACMYAISELQDRQIANAIPLTREMITRSFKENPSRLTDEMLAMYKTFKIE